MRILLLGAALVTAAPSISSACEPPPCWPGAFVPRDGGSVPANIPAFTWRPLQQFQSQGAVDPTQVALYADDAPTTPLALTASAQADGTYRLVPAAPLEAGKHYKLVDHTTCPQGSSFETPSAGFTTTASAPLPTSLGTVAATDLGVIGLSIATASGTCSVDTYSDTWDLVVNLTTEATPWHDVLMYQTTVDGAAWAAGGSLNGESDPGTSWRGRGLDRVFHVCGGGDSASSTGLAEGFHDVVFHATLAGTSLALASSPATVNPVCHVVDDLDGGIVAGGDAGAPNSDHGSSSGCSTGSGSSGLLVLGLLGFARRQRPRSR